MIVLPHARYSPYEQTRRVRRQVAENLDAIANALAGWVNSADRDVSIDEILGALRDQADQIRP